jgi:FtsP/CotA-like multicopper oxidase with cupredoxin domain
MKRRDFIKYTGAGLGALIVGAKMPWLMDNPAYAAVPVTTVNFRITDAVKEMATFNAINPAAQCYFWIYKEDNLPADCPGPIIFTTQGSKVKFVVTNDLDEPHALSVPRHGFTTGPIAPGATVTKTLTAGNAGTYLYYDDLNAPVNRVMGLHGALIIMPKIPTKPGKNRVTPFSKPPSRIKQLFNDLGTAAWWPGLAWEEGDLTTDTPAFRQYIWLLHQASPHLFAEVGNHPAGQDYPAAQFIQKFLHDPLDPDAPVGLDGFPANNIAQYFTISGQSGHFSHNNPYICPFNRVGEPAIIRILNAGLWLHSTHIHANHVYVLSRNNTFAPFPGSNDNSLWVDVYTAAPLDTYEWLVPYMRPPDVPNNLGIGRDDLETSLPVAFPDPIPDYGTGGGPTPPGVTTWPPEQELDFHIPKVGQRMALDQQGNPIDLSVHMSPLCFPMHDHSEPSQVSQGGNYNCGMISGINFTGDRKGAGPGGAGVITFEMTPPEHGPNFNDGVVPPTVPFVAPSLP